MTVVAPVDYLVLSQEDVVAAGGLDMDACLATIEETLVLHHRGETVAPQKSALHWSDDIDTDEKLGRIMAMPAFVGGSIAMAGMKWIPSVPGNPSRGLPRGIGVILLSDPETGLPVCFMDGTVVSAMRTGAVSGLAARELARPGVAGRHAVRRGGSGAHAAGGAREDPAGARRDPRRRPDPGTDRALRRAGGGRATSDRALRRPSPSGRRRGRARSGRAWRPSPFVDADWVDAGALVLSVSSLDIAVEVVASADLVVTDDLEHETFHPSRPLSRAREAGMLADGEVVPLGAILAGDHPGRTGDEQRIVVSAVGLGIEDVAFATAVYRRALAEGVGSTQRLWQQPIWT